MEEFNLDTNRPYEKITSMLTDFPYKYFFKVHTIYNITVNPTWEIENNRINKDLHLVFVKKGKGIYVLDKQKEPLSEGKVIFVSDGFPHTAKTEPENPVQIIPVRFGIYDIKTKKQVVKTKGPFCFSFVPNDLAKYTQLFESLYKYYNDKNLFSNIELCSSILSQIMYQCIFDLKVEVERSLKDDRIKKIMDFINLEHDCRFTVEHLAKMVSLSPKYFIRLFKSNTGETPRQYIIKKRIDYSIFLLKETDMKIHDIAIVLGYTDQYTFSKQFKVVTGKMPSDSRRNDLKSKSSKG